MFFNEAVEKNSELILSAQSYIWANAETGYREDKTSNFLKEKFESLGYDTVAAGDVPGFYTVLDTGREGPEILIFGEMDALLCAEHPDADKRTGAVHCCGHSAQCAALVGIAAALKEPNVTDKLCGRIRLCAVPAEELIEIEYRRALKEKGIIKHFSGKAEFLRRGYFDGVDMALMVHTSQHGEMFAGLGAVGCAVKNITYKGVSAHAGGAPWSGCNALYAATQGLSAINAIRETFKENDIIRVHPIVTNGGAAVNAIPDKVTLESYVRGKTYEAILDANKRVNRALCGAALSLGANIEINDMFGYSPLENANGLLEVAKEAAKVLPDISFTTDNSFSSGSTDMGDISAIMPALHPYMPGAVGTSHGANYYIKDPVLACVGSAKWQMAMLYILLSNGAVRAKQIIADFKPKFASKEEYFSFIESFSCGGDRILYDENTATVKL